MSRDLTPVQYYLLSEHNKDKGLSAFEVMESTSWVINGVSHPLHSKEEIDLRRQYRRQRMVGRNPLLYNPSETWSYQSQPAGY